LNALVEELEVEGELFLIISWELFLKIWWNLSNRVQMHSTALKSDAERITTCIQSEYQMQMEKLPMKVRNMTVQEFIQQIGVFWHYKPHSATDLQMLKSFLQPQ
jgi:hypothetical protein